MSQKPILLLVDKRDESNEPSEMQQNSFKNSGFRSTQIDPLEDKQRSMKAVHDFQFLTQLQDRVQALQQRVTRLESNSKNGRILKRIRRKANQINRDYQCPYPQCAKFYGSDTSLKNHLKLKHPETC